MTIHKKIFSLFLCTFLITHSALIFSGDFPEIFTHVSEEQQEENNLQTALQLAGMGSLILTGALIYDTYAELAHIERCLDFEYQSGECSTAGEHIISKTPTSIIFFGAAIAALGITHIGFQAARICFRETQEACNGLSLLFSRIQFSADSN